MFTLTHQERKVLIFIGSLILLGSLIRSLNTISPDQDKVITSRNSVANQLISINKASAEVLKSIPGIGEVIASRIIEYRTRLGSFRDLEDLKKVNGIGDKKIEIIKKYITFN